MYQSHQRARLKVREAVWAMKKSDDIALVLEVLRQSLQDWQIPFYACSIAVLDEGPGGQHVRHFSMTKEAAVLGKTTTEVGKGSPIVHFVSQRKAVYRPDLEADDPFDEKKAIQGAYAQPIRTVLDIPFSLGSLSVCSLAADAYEQEHIDLLQFLLPDFEDGFKRLKDLGRLEDQNNALERSNRELDQFAYVASHDLKAPLRGIDNLTQWIVEDADALLPAESRRHLDMLQARVKRMELLLEDLLQYSRIGRQESQVQLVDSLGLVEKVVALLDPPETMAIKIAADLPELQAVPAALEIVMRNLIGNALKHHDRPEGTIEIDWRQQGAFAEFSVSDDGPGIAAEFHQRIFNLFQTLKPRDEVEGSGMGLAMVKKTVEHYGGKVAVEGRQQRGTCFRFSWPLAGQ